jgi:hypothetical protein
MPEEEYEAWRRSEYGRTGGSVYEANRMSLEEAEETIQRAKKWEIEDADV